MRGKNARSGCVAELVYAYGSEPYPARVGSSSLPAPTRRETRSVSDWFFVAAATERQGFSGTPRAWFDELTTSRAVEGEVVNGWAARAEVCNPHLDPDLDP